MVLLRTQERKNYDVDRMSKTIFAREMEASKKRSMVRKKKERRRKAKERRKSKKYQKYCLKTLNEFLNNPDNIDGVFLKLKQIEETVVKRESNVKASLYNSVFDTFENKLKRLNNELNKKINLNEDISPSEFSPEDILCIVKWCKQFSDNEKYLSVNSTFGRFNGPQSCDQHRNIVSMHFENTMHRAVECQNDFRVNRLLDIIDRYNATNAKGEFDIFDMEANTFTRFTESYKRVLKSHIFKGKKRVQPRKEQKHEQRKIDREKRVRDRRNKKLLEKGVVPPVDSTGNISVDRQNRMNRRYQQKLLLDQPPNVITEINDVVEFNDNMGYISSDTDDEEWGVYNNTRIRGDDEEFDAGF